MEKERKMSNKNGERNYQMNNVRDEEWEKIKNYIKKERNGRKEG